MRSDVDVEKELEQTKLIVEEKNANIFQLRAQLGEKDAQIDTQHKTIVELQRVVSQLEDDQAEKEREF